MIFKVSNMKSTKYLFMLLLLQLFVVTAQCVNNKNRINY